VSQLLLPVAVRPCNRYWSGFGPTPERCVTRSTGACLQSGCFWPVARANGKRKSSWPRVVHAPTFRQASAKSPRADCRIAWTRRFEPKLKLSVPSRTPLISNQLPSDAAPTRSTEASPQTSQSPPTSRSPSRAAQNARDGSAVFVVSFGGLALPNSCICPQLDCMHAGPTLDQLRLWNTQANGR